MTGASLPDAASATAPRPWLVAPRRVVVVGAGAFGGWTALHLRRRGLEVTLVDAWGPAHPRASSGGETRVIRGLYGTDKVYVDWVARSFELWRDHEACFGQRLYHETGCLWLMGADDSYVRASLPLARAAGLEAERLEVAEASRRFPQVSFDGVEHVVLEHRAGYLLARRACVSLVHALVMEGGAYLRRSARPGRMANDALEELVLSDGGELLADAYVFACGPWLGQVFPELLGGLIRPTRQEAYTFGPPAGDARFLEEALPVWVDFGERLYYGVPGGEGRGFKVACDDRGPSFDPTTGERTVTPAELEAARRHLAQRFPGMAGAPLVAAEVCQYANTPDGHFLIDRHPEAENVWIVGGGSGHGFKVSPALGEHVAGLVAGDGDPDPFFALSRFDGGAGGKRTQVGGSWEERDDG